MEPVIYSQLVRNTGNNLNLNWYSELEGAVGTSKPFSPNYR